MYICIDVYIYVYMCIYVYVYIYMYIYIYVLCVNKMGWHRGQGCFTAQLGVYVSSPSVQHGMVYGLGEVQEPQDDSEMMADRTSFRMKSESLFDFSYIMMIEY